MPPTAITLEWFEAQLAASVGVARQLSALRQGLGNRFGYRGAGWDIHVEGAGGEMAAAKALGLYWSGSVDTFKLPDVGTLQIRTRSRDNYDLIVRPGDADDEAFLLVTGSMPSYLVHGWMLGADAKREEWLKTYAARTPAYFVPQSALHPLEGLSTAIAA